MKVALLAGGVGGSRFARALLEDVDAAELTIVGNVGDDLEVLGPARLARPRHGALHARRAPDEERGWGRAGETWNALETVGALGGEDWFRLGDLDLGLHLVRTQALRAGEPLSAVTAAAGGARSGVETRLAAGDRRPRCAPGRRRPRATFPFQEWFVARGAPRRGRRASRFEGAEAARPAPGVLEALDAADAAR